MIHGKRTACHANLRTMSNGPTSWIIEPAWHGLRQRHATGISRGPGALLPSRSQPQRPTPGPPTVVLMEALGRLRHACALLPDHGSQRELCAPLTSPIHGAWRILDQYYMKPLFGSL